MKSKKEFAEVRIKVEKCCLSCVKSDVREGDDEALFCTLSGHEVADRMSCDAWECNLEMFKFFGFDVAGVGR